MDKTIEQLSNLSLMNDLDNITDSDVLDDMYNNLNIDQEKNKNMINRIVNHAHYKQKNLRALVNVITNSYQQDILYRISQHYEEDRLYMIDYTPNADAKKPNLEGTFLVLGAYNYSKNMRTQYDIKMFKANSNDKGSFWCSCPDHKFNSSKKQTVCKHICFLVCHIAKIMTKHFFETKQLSQKQIDDLIQKVSKNSTIWKDNNVCRKVTTLSLASFQERKKGIDDEDVCPICYDAFGEKDILTCPTCTNYVHDECMAVWMERQKRCVYCTSTVWEHYKTVKNGGVINLTI